MGRAGDRPCESQTMKRSATPGDSYAHTPAVPLTLTDAT
jgi:hypothetical protein